jgi:hypothetical protein
MLLGFAWLGRTTNHERKGILTRYMVNIILEMKNQLA